MITQKGKVYKYDAAECMIQALAEMDVESVALTLVTDYNAPFRIDRCHNLLLLL